MLWVTQYISWFNWCGTYHRKQNIFMNWIAWRSRRISHNYFLHIVEYIAEWVKHKIFLLFHSFKSLILYSFKHFYSIVYSIKLLSNVITNVETKNTHDDFFFWCWFKLVSKIMLKKIGCNKRILSNTLLLINLYVA